MTDSIVDAAKAAGATVTPSHGKGIRRAQTFFGLTLEAQTDLVMFLLEERLVEAVMTAIGKVGRFEKPGTGIAFVLPVDQVISIESQIERFKEEIRGEHFKTRNSESGSRISG